MVSTIEASDSPYFDALFYSTFCTKNQDITGDFSLEVMSSEIMKSIGPEGVMKETDYQEWPLFKDFRAVESFLKAYESVFGKPFVHIESILQSDEKERRLKKLEHLKKQLEEKTGPMNSGDDTVHH